jgi:hypothetical protein
MVVIKTMVSRVALVFVAAAAVVAAGCDQVPLLAPTASTIIVSAGATSLAPGASTTITASVVESGGTPVHDGTLVRFTTTLGRVDPAAVETQGGVATTTFIAGTASGTAEIQATSGGATGGTGTPPTNVVSIQVGGAAATGVAISASPSRVASSGGTVTIIASAVDAGGNRLVGVPVTFTSSQGTLSASSATTDSNGEARVSLTTNRETTVTARVGSGGTGQTATTTVSVGTAGTVTLTTSPASPLAGSPVTLTVTPAANTMPRVVVTWGDGTVEDLGVVAATRTVTHIYQSSGSYTITATATADGETFGTSTGVTVTSAAAGVRLESTPPNPVVGSPVTLTVTAGTGTTPRVAINWGDGTAQDLGTVTGSRAVSHTYGAPGSYGITATATAGGDTSTTSLAINVAARPPVGVNVTDNRGGSPQRCQSVTFTAAVTPAGETVSSYEWQISSESSPVTTTGNQLTRIFTTTGTRTVTVSATTPDGRVGTGQTQVSVVEPTVPATCS